MDKQRLERLLSDYLRVATKAKTKFNYSKVNPDDTWIKVQKKDYLLFDNFRDADQIQILKDDIIDIILNDYTIETDGRAIMAQELEFAFIGHDSYVLDTEGIELGFDMTKIRDPFYKDFSDKMLAECTARKLPIDYMIALNGNFSAGAFTYGMKSMFLKKKDLKKGKLTQIEPIIIHEATHNKYPSQVYGLVIAEAMADYYALDYAFENGLRKHNKTLVERLATYKGYLKRPDMAREKAILDDLVKNSGMRLTDTTVDSWIHSELYLRNIYNTPEKNRNLIQYITGGERVTASDNIPQYDHLLKCIDEYSDNRYGDGWRSWNVFLKKLADPDHLMYV